MDEKEIKKAIIRMATDRGADKTICPSEVARELFGDNWRNKMQDIRDAAIDLESESEIVVSQKGEKVDPKQVKGPIRIRIKN